MKHYLDEDGYPQNIEIPVQSVDKFLELFVNHNVKEDGTINMGAVMKDIYAAENKQYVVMYQYELCKTLHGLGRNPIAESILGDDAIKLFILELLQFFVAQDYIRQEFPLFLHNTFMDLGFNLYSFDD